MRHASDSATATEQPLMMVGYWDFFQDEDGRWRWRYSSSEQQRVSECDRGYATPDDCIADAKRHGYGTLHQHRSPRGV